MGQVLLIGRYLYSLQYGLEYNRMSFRFLPVHLASILCSVLRRGFPYHSAVTLLGLLSVPYREQKYVQVTEHICIIEHKTSVY